MRTTTGNLWDLHAQGVWIGITTNGILKKDGSAVMGAGLAKQAALRFPVLPHLLGQRLRYDGNHAFTWSDFRLVTFPTKHDWRAPSDLRLIIQSATELSALLDLRGIRSFAMPRPGCGLGQLDWSVVEPAIAPILGDRVLIVTPA